MSVLEGVTVADQDGNQLFIGIVIGIAILSLGACALGVGEPKYSSEEEYLKATGGYDSQQESGPDQYDTGRP